MEISMAVKSPHSRRAPLWPRKLADGNAVRVNDGHQSGGGREAGG